MKFWFAFPPKVSQRNAVRKNEIEMMREMDAHRGTECSNANRTSYFWNKDDYLLFYLYTFIFLKENGQTYQITAATRKDNVKWQMRRSFSLNKPRRFVLTLWIQRQLLVHKFLCVQLSISKIFIHNKWTSIQRHVNTHAHGRTYAWIYSHTHRLWLYTQATNALSKIMRSIELSI